MDSLGAIVVGRTLFDVTDGWGGRHTMDAPVVVVTHEVPTDWVQAHPDAPFTFVTDGVAAAIARRAGHRRRQGGRGGGRHDRPAVPRARPARRGRVDLVPVVMGRGRPYFGEMGITDVMLGDPTTCIQGDRVTHLVFPVQR